MGNKELNKTIKRLLKLSASIVDKFEILASLAFHNKEYSEQYLEHFNLLNDYLYRETIIVNNLSIDELETIFKLLPEYDDNSDGYMRLHIFIDDKINEYLIKNNEDKNENEDYQEDSEESINDDNQSEIISDNEDEVINKYYTEEENEKYAGMVMDNIAIIVLKKMYDRINNTYADNKKDNKYKKRLLKELKSFKYWVLAIDRNLETIGVNYKFDISKIPTYNELNFDISSICHNDCVDFIERMYNNSEIDYDPTAMSEVLFNFMCFEEFIKYIDDESVDKLIELCDELGKSNNFFSNKVREKLIMNKR